MSSKERTAVRHFAMFVIVIDIKVDFVQFLPENVYLTRTDRKMDFIAHVLDPVTVLSKSITKKNYERRVVLGLLHGSDRPDGLVIAKRS